VICLELSIADRIKLLRERNHYTQSELARKLGITRSSVNTLEMGISIPSTSTIIQLADLLHTTTDYLFGREQKETINVTSLNEQEKEIIYQLINYFNQQKSK